MGGRCSTKCGHPFREHPLGDPALTYELTFLLFSGELLSPIFTTFEFCIQIDLAEDILDFSQRFRIRTVIF
jgi:hypothetical protein